MICVQCGRPLKPAGSWCYSKHHDPAKVGTGFLMWECPGQHRGRLYTSPLPKRFVVIPRDRS